MILTLVVLSPSPNFIFHGPHVFCFCDQFSIEFFTGPAFESHHLSSCLNESLSIKHVSIPFLDTGSLYVVHVNEFVVYSEPFLFPIHIPLSN